MKNDMALLMYGKKFGGKILPDNGGKELVKTKLVSGEVLMISKNRIVGYCHCYLHRGALTKNLLKEHDCVGKGCHYFEKCAEAPYWVEKQKKRDESARQRERKRTEEEQKKALDESRIREAQKIADLLGYDMKVIQIKKTEGKKHFVMFYISDRDENDWYRFVDLAREFGHSRWAYVELRHIKDMQGNYVTF